MMPDKMENRPREESYSDCEIVAVKKTKKEKTLQKFRPKYTKQHPCILITKKGVHFAWCNLCCTNFGIGHGGLVYDVTRDCTKNQDHLALGKRKSSIGNFLIANPVLWLFPFFLQLPNSLPDVWWDCFHAWLCIQLLIYVFCEIYTSCVVFKTFWRFGLHIVCEYYTFGILGFHMVF